MSLDVTKAASDPPEPGRDAAPLAGWLGGHPKPQAICRDLASAFAEGCPDEITTSDVL